jgi:nitroimidazol reductase NimA-like FMN-containing flavoprotein (pyridoxamine 5'-phosphate oxidase superfamily)
MPRRMTEKEHQEFLAEPHIGVLSVAAGDDRPPHTTPVWYGFDRAEVSRSSQVRRAARPGSSRRLVS